MIFMRWTKDQLGMYYDTLHLYFTFSVGQFNNRVFANTVLPYTGMGRIGSQNKTWAQNETLYESGVTNNMGYSF